jgi:hypothetical protein
VIKMIEVHGITNLQDYFYDKSAKWLNKYVDPVFMLSHLVAIVDHEKATKHIDDH